MAPAWPRDRLRPGRRRRVGPVHHGVHAGRGDARRHLDLLPQPSRRGPAGARPHAHQPACSSAAEAEAWGLVNRVVPDEEVESAPRALAEELAGGATHALGWAKRLIYEGHDSPLPEAGEREGQVIAGAMATADGREGIAAFVEKRPAEFTGR